MEINEGNALQMFGLTNSQFKILYSLEKIMTEQDILLNDKGSIDKEHWLNRWTANVCASLGLSGTNQLLSKPELMRTITREINQGLQGMNRTWFYLIMLEGALFQAYVPLGESKDADKRYGKLKYKPQNAVLEEVAMCSNIMDSAYIRRFQKTYQKTIDKLSGKLQKVALGAVSIVAVSAIAAATAGAMAGPIAVALFGGNFTLHGAALTSACLAMAGGGAVAASGAGMAGGVMAIVEGGALLGAAGGGASVAAANMFIKSAPSFALSQAAKLEVVLKEISLNAQQDIQNAQIIMDNFKSQIHRLQKELDDLKLEKEADRTMIKNMEKSLSYFRKAYQDMNQFKSSFEVGLEASAAE